jgi:hypothetical protein
MAIALAPSGVFHFKQVSALNATEVRLSFPACNPRPASKTVQLVQRVIHG